MRRLVVIALSTIALAAAVVTTLIVRAPDPSYAFAEFLSLGRFHRYDDLIAAASERYNVPEELIKAVIWRESRFHPDKVGAHGERGLMQITEGAASDWAKAEKISTFVPTDLFDPKVNIEAGTWYLRRALTHWGERDDPIPFALAEYNAGRTRVVRWTKETGHEPTAGAIDMQAAMDFPLTKKYISAIIARYEFYRDTDEFEGR